MSKKATKKQKKTRVMVIIAKEDTVDILVANRKEELSETINRARSSGANVSTTNVKTSCKARH